MALTKEDKAWIRKVLREIIEENRTHSDTVQLGGYDGATLVVDDDTEGRQRKRTVGF